MFYVKNTCILKMFKSHFGEIAALATALFWTVTALAFESAGKKIGSLTVNLLRLILGFICLSVYTFIARGYLFPTDATFHAWIWLSLSGVIGFVLGDLFLFQAFVVIGARISMLLMALVPPFTAIIGFLLMGEVLDYIDILGMAMVVSGISLVVLKRGERKEKIDKKRRPLKLTLPISGLFLAIGGALGQAAGLVLSKFGMRDYDAFSATQIRVLSGIAGFVLLFFFLKRWNKVFLALKNKQGMIHMSIGAFFGPFLGVAFSLLAVQYTKAGIASTIMAIVPVLIIPPSVLIYKEKITIKEIIGAIISVLGVSLLFLK